MNVSNVVVNIEGFPDDKQLTFIGTSFPETVTLLTFGFNSITAYLSVTPLLTQGTWEPASMQSFIITLCTYKHTNQRFNVCFIHACTVLLISSTFTFTILMCMRLELRAVWWPASSRHWVCLVWKKQARRHHPLAMHARVGQFQQKTNEDISWLVSQHLIMDMKRMF